MQFHLRLQSNKNLNLSSGVPLQFPLGEIALANKFCVRMAPVSRAIRKLTGRKLRPAGDILASTYYNAYAAESSRSVSRGDDVPGRVNGSENRYVRRPPLGFGQ